MSFDPSIDVDAGAPSSGSVSVRRVGPGGLDGDRCPFDLCDGSGFVLDEETNTAYDCRCRAQRVALAKARSLSAVIPRRYRDAAFDRPPVTDIEPQVVAAVRRFADCIDSPLDAGRGRWVMGSVGAGQTTLGMLVSSSALKAGPAAAIYSLPPP